MKILFRIILRNIFRQKIFTLMTLMSIVIGVVGIILAGGWVNDIFEKLREALIHSQTGHLQIYAQGYYSKGSQSPEKYLINNPLYIKQKVSEEDRVDNVMSRLYFSGLLNNGRSDLPIIGEGVEPESEAKLGRAIILTSGRNLANKDTYGILLGQGVARSLKVKPGNYVTLLVNTVDGTLNSFEFEVIGIFQSFSNDYDARAIKIPLTTAQILLDTQHVNSLVVVLKDTHDTMIVQSNLIRKLNDFNLEVKTWVDLNDFYVKTETLYRNQFGVLQVIILVMVVLSVSISINISIFERVGEFGTMKALGNNSNDVFRLILLESILLGIIGSSLGIVIGMLIATIISKVGIPMPPPPNADIGYIAQIQITYSVLLLSFAIGSCATIIAAIIPAKKISQVEIIEALKKNY